MYSTSLRHATGAAGLGVLAILAACAQPEPPAPPVPEVEVIEAQPQRLTVVQNLVGRISAIRSAEVRARVAGIIQKRVYEEGTDVREGALLFVIDPAPFRAELREQEAALTQARASAANAKARAERFKGLARTGVVAQQDLDDAISQANATAAAVEQAQAAVEQARVDLSYTMVRAPIGGRASKALVTEGALVGQTEATHLTTIEQLGEVYVNFNQSVSELQALRSEAARGGLDLAQPEQRRVRVAFQDGTPYPHEGTLGFYDLAVDPNTGAVALRAVLPNPERQLLPGMFVNVMLEQGARQNAYRVPQGAVQRDSKGLFAYVVGADGKAVQRHLQTQGMEGGDWVVTSGLSPGDRIVVAGIQRVRPGAPVKAVLAAAPEGTPDGTREAAATSATTADAAPTR